MLTISRGMTNYYLQRKQRTLFFFSFFPFFFFYFLFFPGPLLSLTSFSGVGLTRSHREQNIICVYCYYPSREIPNARVKINKNGRKNARFNSIHIIYNLPIYVNFNVLQTRINDFSRESFAS